MFTLFTTLVLAAAPAAQTSLAIHADKALLGDGRTLDDAWIVLEGGKIRSVESGGEAPPGASRYEHHGWVSAGLIGLHGYAGATGELRDATRAAMPEAKAAWAFDPTHPEFADCVKQGITTLVLTPTPNSLVGGVSAVVKCAGGTLVSREAQLTFGFSSRALANNRFPTSFAASVAELDRLLEKPTGVLEKAKDGDLLVLFEVNARPDVQRAIAFAKRHELKGALSGADWTGELAKTVKDSGLAVVLPHITAGEEQRTLRAVKSLGEAGVPFGFGLDVPGSHPAELRLAAALCVRAGLPADKAWRALGSDAARIAGVEKRVGALEAGLDADLVLWSGDPLDLTSSIAAVFVDGKLEYSAEAR